MKLIDIDKIESIENHVHYIKIYKASAILMDKKAILSRYNIEFSLEYKPLEGPSIKVKFKEHPHFPLISIMKEVKNKIIELEKAGKLSQVHKK